MKKIIVLVFMALMMFILAVPASAAVVGDVDGNGKITAADARLVLRFSASLDVPDDSQKKVSDVNSDGKITAADARKVLRIAASLEPAVEPENLKLNSDASDKKLTPYEIYEKASSFTVEILTYTEKGTARTIGSGFFITENAVVTNYHVIDDAHYAKIKTYDGRIFDVKSVLGYDTKKDIAILSVNAENVGCAVVADDVSVGDRIYTLGSTKGFTGTFTEGIVSSVDRVIADMNNSVRYIQITAPVAEGNSGGPVLDEMGNVIGIVSLTHDDGQNLNFAIPVYEAEKTDISSPVTLSDLSKKNGNKFTGSIVLANEGVTLKKGGTALIYAIVAASEEYNLVCETSNDTVKAEIGRNYGGVNVVYVSALAETGSAEVRVYMNGHEDISAILYVTVGDEAPVFYNGIQGAVPDFGVLAGVAPSEYDENTLDGKTCYSFTYSFDSLNSAGVSTQDSISRYVSVMEDNGYDYISTSEDNTFINFLNEKEKTSVIFGLAADENDEYYMYVLIIR